MFDYDFCEDRTQPRIFVLGLSGSGKSTLINILKENWDKFADEKTYHVQCPNFYNIDGLDMDFDFKDEMGNDVISEICLCHDISLPFSEEEKNVIEKIKEISNTNVLCNPILIMTKSDLVNFDGFKNFCNETTRNLNVMTRVMTQTGDEKNNQVESCIDLMVVMFKISKMIEDQQRAVKRFEREDEQAEVIKIIVTSKFEDRKLRARKLPKIFKDTMRQCGKNTVLADAIKKSLEHQIVLLEKDNLDASKENRFSEHAKIIVSKNRTFQTAQNYKEGKVCVLNFANSFTPGGCVRMGTGTQEEALCRCSTLYPCISKKSVMEKFYNAHYNALKSGAMTELANDDCIYTPDVIVFKSDTILPELLSESEWFKTDVITCAAPNLSGIENYAISKKEFCLIHYCRGKRILELAKSQGVDHLILGAFGCGAFRNPPDIVALIYKRLVDEYKFDFRTIEFAIYCADYETENYKEFKKVFE